MGVERERESVRVENLYTETILEFVHGSIEPGSVICTDGLNSYLVLPLEGYVHDRVISSKSKETVYELLPGVHCVASLLKRWLLGTHQGVVSPQHLNYCLDEFAFRFNRRMSRHRGKLFYRLIQ